MEQGEGRQLIFKGWQQFYSRDCFAIQEGATHTKKNEYLAKEVCMKQWFHQVVLLCMNLVWFHFAVIILVTCIFICDISNTGPYHLKKLLVIKLQGVHALTLPLGSRYRGGINSLIKALMGLAHSLIGNILHRLTQFGYYPQ